MSGGGQGFRVSGIPRNVRNTIQNIKETGCCHSEEEIYAMLKECRMDPNETVQKLLLQDTFHEVKRKKDRRKENMNNREATDSRWRSGPFGLVGRGGRGSFPSRHSADASGDKHSFSATGNGIKQASENVVQDSLTPAEDAKTKKTAPASSVTLLDDGPKHTSDLKSANSPEVSSVEETPGDATINLSVGSSDRFTERPNSKSSTIIGHSAGTSGGQNVHKTRSSSAHEKMSSKPHGAGMDQPAEVSRPSSSSGHGGSLSNRLSSNDGSRSRKVTGPPRGPTKEWKPKASYSNRAPVSGSSAGSEQSAAAVTPETAVAAENALQNLGVYGNTSDSEEPSLKSEEELDVSHIRDTDNDNVIIPNHIHVGEAIRNVLCFGSFNAAKVSCQTAEDSAAGQLISDNNVVAPPEEEDSIGHPHPSTHVPETVPIDNNVVAPPNDEDSIDHPHSSAHVPETVPSDNNVVAPPKEEDPIGAKVSSSSAFVGESEKISGITEHHMIHTSPAYSFAAEQMPVLGNTTSSDISDGQAHHASRASNFTVQQPTEAGSARFYEQFYHSGVSDGHISPFAASASYNGNFPFLPAQTSDSLHEGGNHVRFSTAGHAHANQSGIMLSNIPVTQQAVPLYRQPTGLPMPQYSPNYMPYGHYYPPFYASPSPSYQYVGNDAFLQQAQTSIYPATATGAAAGVKFAVPQFKRGGHAGHPTHMSTSGGNGMYGAPAAGHNGGSVAAAGNSGANGDHAGSQYRENNVYNAGQQTGSTVWIAASGRAINGLEATSFYNLPPQGQHVTFPLSRGHVSFASAYHPAQAATAAIVHPLLQHSQAMPGAVDMLGSTPAGVYHQPRHATQMSWPNNS